MSEIQFRQIIDNKLYDVSKATYVGKGVHCSIYKTQKGAFFLLYFSQNIPTRIELATPMMVKSHLMHADIDAYIELYGGVEEA